MSHLCRGKFRLISLGACYGEEALTLHDQHRHRQRVQEVFASFHETLFICLKPKSIQSYGTSVRIGLILDDGASTAKRMNRAMQTGLGSRPCFSVMENVPGPTEYHPEKVCRIGSFSQKGPSLGSAKRELNKARSDAPPPGTYDVATSYEMSQTKRRLAPPLTVEGKARQSAFLVAAERFNKWSNLGPKDPNLPGPSEYCIPSALNEKSGKFVYQSERFKPTKPEDALPGPAHYQVKAFNCYC
ncbi:unnamed protein product [Echinostoma caproni]|uniref:Sperm-tail PG-rich repeat-containing protein 2 n=1 Tax=Echinostoma caproni TaxID=27848 RepID=A0A183AGB3_9TREM|nr:unnamed protein product [Echinostoma caproni]